MKRLLPVFLAFAVAPAFAVTPQVQHTCVAMGRFARQVQLARQGGMPAARMRQQVDATRGSPAEHQLWREVISTVYQMPMQAGSDQVDRSFYENCMAQMSRKPR